MFTKESEVQKNALLFEFSTAAEQSLHMFFVFYTIDVLFLDDKKQVVDVREGFRPFTVYNSRRAAKYVVELPDGAVQKSRTVLGDVLEW
jgi:uncharacterized membrane protein (UPF0127 family)